MGNKISTIVFILSATLTVFSGSRYAHCDTVQFAPLTGAVVAGRADMVLRLLRDGSDVNQRDKNGRTALMYAAGIWLGDSEHEAFVRGKITQSKENTLIVQELLKAGALPNLVTEAGESALISAVFHDRLGTVWLLVKGGADVNIHPSASGMSPLMYAAYLCYSNMSRLLLDLGADPSYRDSSGDSALSLAEKQHCSDVVLQLSKNGRPMGSD